MAWNTNKRACKALYFSLQRAEQIDLLTEFEDAGDMTMDQLLFFNQHASAELRRIDATILAYRLDNEFTKIYRARYEDDETSSSSILHMISVLMEKEDTVEALSDVVDACYKFRDEKKPVV